MEGKFGTFGQRTSFQLVQAAQEGNQTALSELIELYLPRLRRWSHGRLPRWARQLLNTDDLIQETFFNVVRKADRFQYRHEGAFQAYLRRALKNRINDEIRRVGRQGDKTTIEADHGAQQLSPLDMAIGKETLERYEKAFESLSPRDQEAVHARVELGLSYAEVADVMGLSSPDAARMATTRALVRLTESMKRLKVRAFESGNP